MKTRFSRSGFTIIELMIVVFFFVVMSGAMIVSINRFSQSVLISDLAYDVALTIRQAQTYGISVRERGGKFISGYGVRFVSVDKEKFLFFADDQDAGGLYNKRCGNTSAIDDCRATPEFIKLFFIKKGNYILDFCAVKQDNGEECMGTGVLTYLDITFLRPVPEPFFRTNLSSVGAGDVPENRYKRAYIKVKNPSGDQTKIITVSSLGDILVQ